MVCFVRVLSVPGFTKKKYETQNPLSPETDDPAINSSVAPVFAKPQVRPKPQIYTLLYSTLLNNTPMGNATVHRPFV